LHSKNPTTRGFTLIEAAVVVAIIGILAAVAAGGFAAARRNAGVGSTVFDLTLRLQGLKTKALQEQKDYVFIVMNPTGGVSTDCGVLSQDKCLRWFLVSDPTTAWTLAAFNATSPGANCSVEDSGSLATGVVLDVGAAGTAGPVPFNQVQQLDANVRGSCSGRTCVAVRFTSSGEVNPVYAGASQPLLQGVAFGLTSDAAGERRAVLVSFPTGIVKTFTY
jgi:prepilin-type N-terminal cleavage/methylation domain-containing protein